MSIDTPTVPSVEQFLDSGRADRCCPVCEEDTNKRHLFDFGEFGIFVCGNCQTQHLSPLPSPEQLAAIYNSDYYGGDDDKHGYDNYYKEKDNHQKTYKRRLKLAAKYLRDRSETGPCYIHEVGCALGHGMEIIPQVVDAIVSGSDISDEAIKACRENGHQVFKTDSFGRCELPQKMDMIFGFDFIEHLPRLAPFKEWAFNALKDQGFLCLATPNMTSIPNRLIGRNSPSYKIPEHTIYFSTQSLINALNSHFELVDSWADFQVVPLETFLTRGIAALGFKTSANNRISGPNIWSPNGMRLYLFRKLRDPK